jgi:hypothetical protein
VIRPRSPWKGLDDVELAVLEWVDWHNHRRLHTACYDLLPAEYEQIHYGQPGPTSGRSLNHLSLRTHRGGSASLASKVDSPVTHRVVVVFELRRERPRALADPSRAGRTLRRGLRRKARAQSLSVRGSVSRVRTPDLASPRLTM